MKPFRRVVSQIYRYVLGQKAQRRSRILNLAPILHPFRWPILDCRLGCADLRDGDPPENLRGCATFDHEANAASIFSPDHSRLTRVTQSAKRWNCLAGKKNWTAKVRETWTAKGSDRLSGRPFAGEAHFVVSGLSVTADGSSVVPLAGAVAAGCWRSESI